MYQGTASRESLAQLAGVKGLTGIGQGQNNKSVTALQEEAGVRQGAPELVAGDKRQRAAKN